MATNSKATNPKATNPNTTPEYCQLSDRDLVLRILADPRRRVAVELLVLELEQAERRDRNYMRFEITIAGRRVAILPQGQIRETLLPKETA